MSIEVEVQPLGSVLPRTVFSWIPGTEILSGQFTLSPPVAGSQWSVEMNGAAGSFVTLNAVDGTLTGVELVVWPATESVTVLCPPRAERAGRLRLAGAIPSGGDGLVDLQVPLACQRNPDESTIHVVIGRPDRVETVAVADGITVEVDAADRLAGFWLCNVPPFPRSSART